MCITWLDLSWVREQAQVLAQSKKKSLVGAATSVTILRTATGLLLPRSLHSKEAPMDDDDAAVSLMIPVAVWRGRGWMGSVTDVRTRAWWEFSSVGALSTTNDEPSRALSGHHILSLWVVVVDTTAVGPHRWSSWKGNGLFAGRSGSWMVTSDDGVVAERAGIVGVFLVAGCVR